MHSLGHWSIKSVCTFAIIIFISLVESIIAQETAAPFLVTNGKIAFVRKANNGPGYTRIFVMNPDGSNQMRVGNSLAPFGEVSPTWSPDGQKIAFSGRQGFPRANIFLMDADGSNQIFLTNNPDGTWDESPAWSPDGSKIAFARLLDANGAPPDNRFQIYVMNSDGSNQMRLTNVTAERGNVQPTWSPDGNRIAFTHFGSVTESVYCEIYVMNADGSNQTQLTTSPGRTVNHSPAWSPDSTTIAFHRYRIGPGYGIQEGIYLMNSEGSNVRIITAHGGESPAWSPDGTKIAYTSYVTGGATVHVMDADGSNDVALTLNTSSSYSFSWQPLPQPQTRVPTGQ